MKSNIKFVTGILSLIIFIIIVSISDKSTVNYKLEKINLQLYSLSLYGDGCYLYNVTDGYFIIKNKGPGIKYIVPLVEYVNTTSFIFCNQTIHYSITLEVCPPIWYPCNVSCTPRGICPTVRCPEYPCFNMTYHINITHPIIIANNDIFLYNNNVYCYSENNCNIIYQLLPREYIYGLIYQLIVSRPPVLPVTSTSE
ncbi:MAG: hypothetical protein ACO2OX_04680 [Candidatus Nanopusillus sp.]